jgi:hypothetical protein
MCKRPDPVRVPDFVQNVSVINEESIEVDSSDEINQSSQIQGPEMIESSPEFKTSGLTQLFSTKLVIQSHNKQVKKKEESKQMLLI